MLKRISVRRFTILLRHSITHESTIVCRCNIRVLEILWRSQSHVGVDSDLIQGLKTWIQKQVFDDFSSVISRSDKQMNQIICAADTLATLLELGIESEVRDTNNQL